MAKLEKWRERLREKVFEPLEEWQEKGRQHWLSLNPRERVIVSVLAAVMTTLIAVLVVKEAVGFIYRHEYLAESNLKNVARIQKLTSDLNQQRSDLLKFERLKGKRGTDFQLNKYLENEAGRSGVSIAKISPTKSKTTQPSENMEWVEVQLMQETMLMPALQFLQSIDETLGLQLVELSIKPQFADPTKLNITAVISNDKSL